MTPKIITTTRATENPAIIPAVFAVSRLSCGVSSVLEVASFLLVVVVLLAEVETNYKVASVKQQKITIKPDQQTGPWMGILS